ncbi:acyl-CoA dehydrogenase family protein [Virgibacillus pantothenticus]|uniref:acyl-CoA dehydrogenase family protein n=1 Tax=Virgibacillus pantothenticus TaxID=1473 RepID=UPI001C223E32|nr:acyl-CoA dehydrogenase family protein [Virgibacillus pantothenticus]MBU8567945.1 acyl-CoA dehydrogenase family protein [Virgibacillus pantothenticus]MBU8601798.1 acyl-CoA dehydrogenase family protein [Virgibacillus pantothenticus]MBU8635952.1 acyl-CoA dehydrogenase family protein [Virgibacillus pantothenticus]MBU8643636.1 acyl-CoA dehydrogenase family protein [Virgibacillus pantothenticus]MBU8647776.1 acyl-CoA dehydrogenase family protein [Virgibacillus pantothenticus]
MQKSEYQEIVLQDVETFVKEEIRPLSSLIEESEELPKNLINKMAAKGYLGACLPKEYGGLELDPVYYGKFTELIGKACSATRTLVTVHTSLVGQTLLRWGTRKQKEKWLPKLISGEKIGAFALSEPDVGSDAKNVQTRYFRDGNKYIIRGLKKWISLGDIADLFIVIASNNGLITAFIVERDMIGVSTKPIKRMLAGRASHLAQVHFDDVIISEESSILGREGGGFDYIVSTALDYGRYSIAWAGVALAQEALDAMVAYSRKREQFGKKIHQFQLIQGIIGDSVTKIHAARSLCLKAGEMRKNSDEEAGIETTIAKYFSSKVASQITAEAVQVHGGYGCSSLYPVERLFRESKVLEIIEGTSQIQQIIISNYGLRKYYNKDIDYVNHHQKI